MAGRTLSFWKKRTRTRGPLLLISEKPQAIRRVSLKLHNVPNTLAGERNGHYSSSAEDDRRAFGAWRKRTKPNEIVAQCLPLARLETSRARCEVKQITNSCCAVRPPKTQPGLSSFSHGNLGNRLLCRKKRFGCPRKVESGVG